MKQARKGEIVVLVTGKWDENFHSLPYGALGEITQVEKGKEFPYDVKFEDRTMPLDRDEFEVL